MLRVTAMTDYQALRWLWRHDSEARWFWLGRFIFSNNLRDAVEDNLYTYGVVRHG